MLCYAGSAGRSLGGSALHTASALAERCSDDEDPFGHGGALDAEEESGASTQRQRNEHESLEEHHVKKLVLGSGVAHQSHESCVSRASLSVGRMEHVSAEIADEGLFRAKPKRVHLS